MIRFRSGRILATTQAAAVLLAAILLLTPLSTANSQEAAGSHAVEAAAYLDEALDILETRFIRRDAIDWTSLREQVTSLAANAMTPEDTHPAIKLAIELLDEPHTFFSRPSRGTTEPNNRDTGMWVRNGIVILVYAGGPADNAGIRRGDRIIRVLENTLIEDTSTPLDSPPVTLDSATHFVRDGTVHSVKLEASTYSSNQSPAAVDLAPILLLELPGHLGSGRVAGGLHYSQVLLHALSTIDSSVCGVIIDLRLNTGGNMWPMLAGLHPLLSDTEFGASLRPPHDDPDSWSSGLQWYLQDNNLGRPRFAQHDLPLAVLTSGYTGSSGELVAIAFQGQDHHDRRTHIRSTDRKHGSHPFRRGATRTHRNVRTGPHRQGLRRQPRAGCAGSSSLGITGQAAAGPRHCGGHELVQQPGLHTCRTPLA